MASRYKTKCLTIKKHCIERLNKWKWNVKFNLPCDSIRLSIITLLQLNTIDNGVISLVRSSTKSIIKYFQNLLHFILNN